MQDPPSGMVQVDLSGNELNEKHVDDINLSLQENSKLLSLDLRRNYVKVDYSALQTIRSKLKSNEAESRKSV